MSFVCMYLIAWRFSTLMVGENKTDEEERSGQRVYKLTWMSVMCESERRKEWIEKVYNVINDVIKNFSEISKEREWSDEAFCFMTLLYYCWVVCWGNTNLHVCLGCASRSLFGRNCVSSSENDKFKVSWYSFLLTFTTNYCRLILFHLYVELRSHSLVITDYFYGLRFTCKNTYLPSASYTYATMSAIKRGCLLAHLRPAYWNAYFVCI